MSDVGIESPPIVSPQQAYDQWAATYDSDPNPLLLLEARAASSLLPPLKGKTVLDVGCGTGRWLEILIRERGARVLGIDFSLRMLQQTWDRPELRGHVVCGDACALPVRSCFDVILCSLVLDYIQDLSLFASELSRVCRTESSVVVTDFHADAYRRGWRRTFQYDGKTLEIASHHHSCADVLWYFREAGFYCDELIEQSFQETDRPLFSSLGRDQLFDQIVGLPAITAFRFSKRVGEKSPFAARIRRHTEWRSPAELFLVGGRVALSGEESERADISVSRGRIQKIELELHGPQACAIDLSGYLALPGLINAHDHLEFNLFPRLGSGRYLSYRDWASDIYHPHRSPVRELVCIPKEVRVHWGAINNVLSGVTTVSHHNEAISPTLRRDLPLRIVNRYGWAHSLGFNPDVNTAWQSTRPGWPFIIHVGEGIDELSRNELHELDRMGFLNSSTVVVHGVAFGAEEIALLRNREAALIWCPSSNYFILGQTLSSATLRELARVALGTDSAMSGAGSLLAEIKIAQRSANLSTNVLFQMVTTRPAEILRLRGRRGQLVVGGLADLVAIPDHGEAPAEELVRACPEDIELVLVGGKPQLLSPKLADRWPEAARGMQTIQREGCTRLIDAPIRELLIATRGHIGCDIRLGGKRVSQ